MSGTIDDLAAKLGPGPVTVQLRQDFKRGGELMATYEMEYPTIAEAMTAIAGDLRAGRVEAVSTGGVALSVEEISDLAAAAAAGRPS